MTFDAISDTAMVSSAFVENAGQCSGVFLSVSEVANLLSVTDRAVRKACEKGRYKSVMILDSGHHQFRIFLSSLPIQAQAAHYLANQPRLTPLEIEAKRLATIAAGREHTLPWTHEESEKRWDAYDRSVGALKKQAIKRQEIVNTFEALQRSGQSATEASNAIREKFGVSNATLTRWRNTVRYLDKRDWLPALLPDEKGHRKAAEFSPEAWAWTKREWGCTSKPDLADVYQRCIELAPGQGWIVPSYKTVMRRVEAQPMWWKVLARDGLKKLADMYPAQQRDYSELQLHDLWSSDGHKIDAWWKGEDGKPYRPTIVVWYDQATRYVLGWAVSKVENSMVIRLALRNAIVNSKAIPKKALLDNGRGYTSKLLTGGTPNRYRFKVKEEDPHGILTQMGVDIGWSTPGRGQSKPLERFWRSFTAVSRMRIFKGAACGRNPAYRPEDCDPAKAVPEALGLDEIEKFMVRYNNRVHRGDSMSGLSPRAQMDARLQNTPVRQPTEAQIRGLLLAAESIRLADDNSINLMGARYWCEELAKLPSRGPYTVRFNPDDLDDDVAVYDGDKFICDAQCVRKSHFHDVDAAKTHNRARNSFKKAMKKAREFAEQADNALLRDFDKPKPAPVAPSGAVLPVPPVAIPVRPLKDYSKKKATPGVATEGDVYTREQMDEWIAKGQKKRFATMGF